LTEKKRPSARAVDLYVAGSMPGLRGIYMFVVPAYRECFGKSEISVAIGSKMHITADGTCAVGADENSPASFTVTWMHIGTLTQAQERFAEHFK
jgi:hypothetical protein